MPKYSTIIPVRVSYSRDKDRIYLLNGDSDQYPELTGLHVTLSPETHSESILRQYLRQKDIIRDFSPGFLLSDLVEDRALSAKDDLMLKMIVKSRVPVLVVGPDKSSIRLMTSALANQFDPQPAVIDAQGPRPEPEPELEITTEGALTEWDLSKPTDNGEMWTVNFALAEMALPVDYEKFEKLCVRIEDMPVPHVLALDLKSLRNMPHLTLGDLKSLHAAAREGDQFLVGRHVWQKEKLEQSVPQIIAEANSWYNGLFSAIVVLKSDVYKEQGFAVEHVELLGN